MKHGKNPTRRQREYIASLWLNPDKKGAFQMRYEYGLAFFCGVVVMALANALSLGLLPCRALAVIFLLVALAAVAVSGYLFGRRSCRKLVQSRSYNEGVRKGLAIGRAERQSEIQRFLEVGDVND